MARGSWAASTTSHVLAAQHCKVYVHELHQPLAAHRQPAAWPSHQHAMELHLAEAAKRSPWRTYTRSEADLVVAVANFSLFCVAGKTFMRRTNWYKMLSDRTLWPHGAANASWDDGAILVVLQANMCGVPWADTRGSFKPRNIVTLAEAMRSADPPSVQVTPFVVAGWSAVATEKRPGSRPGTRSARALAALAALQSNRRPSGRGRGVSCSSSQGTCRSSL
jgi:hypothetical protein